MDTVILDIENEGHTLGCLLRKNLIDTEANISACIVPHPQDNFLRITIQSEQPKENIIDAFQKSLSMIKDMKNTINAYIIHENINKMQD